MLRGTLAIVGLAVSLLLAVPRAQAGPFEDGFAAYERGDYADALRLYHLAAVEGHAGARLNLGNMYLAGQGTPRDDARAAAWYRRAAESGNAGAQFSLGTLYRNGWGVPPGLRRGDEVVSAGRRAGLCLGAEQHRRPLRQGPGHPRNSAEAVHWYRLAAAQGSAMAQFNLGLMVQNGRGVPADPAEARRLFELAAERGVAGAQNQLGIMNAAGAAGLPQDYVQADKWFSLAASHAADDELRALALKNHDRLAAQMTPEQLAEAQKLARAWTPTGAMLAAEQNVPRQAQ